MNGSDPPLTNTIQSLQAEVRELTGSKAALQTEIERLRELADNQQAEIGRLTKENIDRLMQKVKLEDEITRLQSSPTSEETEKLIARLRDYSSFERGDDGDIWNNCKEAAEALHRLARNQMSSNYVMVSQTAALAVQRADALDRKCKQFTEALMRGMTLVDELLRENGRLCAASNEPPSVRLFAAKSGWDTAMHKLLGGDEAL